MVGASLFCWLGHADPYSVNELTQSHYVDKGTVALSSAFQALPCC